MTDPINLNKVRKDRERAERRRQAKQNAIVHGRTKAERARDEAQSKRVISRIESHRLDKDDE